LLVIMVLMLENFNYKWCVARTHAAETSAPPRWYLGPVKIGSK
jgi:hypothetical protein